MTDCHCGSNIAYDKCCDPYLNNAVPAPTAEALMRSRYSAFVTANINYIRDTHHPKTRAGLDVKESEKWARAAQWQSLEVIRTVAGGEQDEQGVVEFKAHYQLQGERCILHEVSKFERKQGRWYYLDGDMPAIKQVRRDTPKIGRNDPCGCGSGKKFKKCCGAA